MKFLGAIYIIWYREQLRFWREKMRLVGSLAFPILFLIVFGCGLSGSIGILAPGVDYARFVFPGIVSMTVLMTSFMSGMSVVWDREFGFLKEVLVAPVSRTAVVAGKILGGVTTAMFQGIIILLLAPLVGVSLSPILVLKLLPLMLVMGCAVAGIGILIASRMKSMEAFIVVMNMLLFPMIFLSGVFFPVNNLPDWMTVLVKVNPVTYGVDSIRQVFLGGAVDSFSVTVFNHTMSIAEDMALVACFALVMVFGAMWSFNRQD